MNLVALLDLWSSNPNAISSFTIEQVVSSAGDGKLKDNSPCSQELREYLAQVRSEKLAEYIAQCLNEPFDKSGLVLQDLVNEVGKRLEFEVTSGRYRGAVGKIGYDGIWKSPEDHAIVVEVKTSNTYTISLDTIVRYRSELVSQGTIASPSSILIVVGREGTGELEAQVRGSRHAWDIRLISTDSLIQLLKVKESTDEYETLKKIRETLVPKEYTKLDGLVEILFATARDVETAVTSEAGASDQIETHPRHHKEKGNQGFTNSAALDKKREAIVDALGRQRSIKFIKKTRATYWDQNHAVRIVCVISKRYERSDIQRYWYAYHPKWHEFLKEGRPGHFVLGCMDLDIAFMIPVDEMQKLLDALNTTKKEETDSMYWHIIIAERSSGSYEMSLPKKSDYLSLTQYAIDV